MKLLNGFNEKKFSEIYDKYSKMILNIGFTYLKNTSDAEDIMQEVFIKYITKSPLFINEEHRKAWLIRVTINLCKDYLKSKKNKINEELYEEIDYLENNEKEILSELFKIDEKYRIVIYLHYYEGYSLKEISKILNSNISTIGTWLSRGKTELKKRLEE